MMSRRMIHQVAAGAALLLIHGTSTALAGGLSVSGQGGKALGMADAFVAQADDPTAVFFNPGGLFQVEEKVSVGLSTLILNEGLFQGLSPGIAAGTAGELETFTALLPHAYLVQPLSEKLRLGVGFFSPFQLDNEWATPDTFAGRSISTKSEFKTYDINAELGIELAPNLGLGFGAVLRISQLTLQRRLQLSGLDVASWDVEGDASYDVGWNIGLLYKASPRLSLGATYRSAISVDHDGVGLLTQIPVDDGGQIDQLVSATFPLGQDLAIQTGIEYPDSGVLGAAFKLSRGLLFELDVEWTGWSRFQQLGVEFLSEPDFSTTYRQAFDDTVTLRLGAQYSFRTGPMLRGGIAFNESPQPHETVGPFLADADRTLYSLGFSLDWLHVAFTWIDVEQRIITSNQDNVNGNYRSNAWMLGLTITK